MNNVLITGYTVNEISDGTEIRFRIHSGQHVYEAFKLHALLTYLFLYFSVFATPKSASNELHGY
jgi:hypothetical protein